MEVGGGGGGGGDKKYEIVAVSISAFAILSVSMWIYYNRYYKPMSSFSTTDGFVRLAGTASEQRQNRESRFNLLQILLSGSTIVNTNTRTEVVDSGTDELLSVQEDA